MTPLPTGLPAGSLDLPAMFVEEFEGWPSSLVRQRTEDGPLVIHQTKRSARNSVGASDCAWTSCGDR